MTAASDPAGGSGDQHPAVVAVVVTRNPGPFLEESLRALAEQDYPALSVLVVDAGSELDPTARVGAAMPAAFVRRVGGSPGFGGAANEALGAVQGATFFLVCHDDVVLDPPAVRVMVEEAFRSNAAIIGPKLVSAEDPSVLVDVGRAIDRLGGSHTGIEPGELDQEQHDAVRDVFYVSSAAMLVRADLFDELGGFDAEAFPGSEDLDLCWRARLAGARVMVAPDARARHHEAAADRGREDLPTERDVARRRARVVLSCYSFATLLWVVPLALVVSFGTALLFAFTRRRRAAFASFTAWWWNLFHWGRVRAARRRAQSKRVIHDRELHELQVGARASVSAFLTQHHADERMEALEERGQNLADSFGDAMRHPASIVVLIFLALLLVGSRSLFSQGVPGVGTMLEWPGVRSIVDELSSAWRHTGLGSTTAAPPVFAGMAGLGTVLFGGVGLAQTLLVVGALLVGPIGAFRLARALQLHPGPAAMTAVVYGIVPVSRNDVANGRLGPIVLFALAPFIVLLLVRLGQFQGVTGVPRKPLLGLVIVTAVASAFFPPAAALGFAVGVAFLVASPLARDATASIRVLGGALIAAAGAAVLLAPWSASFLDLRDDPGVVGASITSPLDLGAVLRFETGPNGAGIATWGVIVAALAALVICRGPRLAWAIRAWSLAVLGYAAVYLPARLAPEALVPAPEAALAVAALGLALAAGLGLAAAAELFARQRLGWRQAVGAVAVVGILLTGLGFAADSLDGRWRGSDGWGNALAFTQDNLADGEFRVLWVGDAAVLPLDAVRIDGRLGYTLTRNGAGDALGINRAAVADADHMVSDAVSVALAGKTSRLGQLLAPTGIRYLAVPSRNGPGAERVDVPAGLTRALGNQLDLARLGAPSGIQLYENESWAPVRSIVLGRTAGDLPTGAQDPLQAAAGYSVQGARPVGEAPVPKGQLLLGEAYDSGWSATAKDETLQHERGFGVLNTWANPSRAHVSIRHSGQGQVYLFLLAQAVLWIVVLVWWGRGRRRDRGAKQPRPREERERPARRPVAEDFGADDDVDFWETV